MRVLIVTNLYPRPGYPTIASYHRLLFKALAKEHEVIVLAPVPWTASLSAKGGHRHVVAWSQDDDGIWVARPRSYHTPKMLTPYYGEMFEWSIGRTFRRLVRDHHPDIVLASWAHPDGWAAVRLARQAKLPVAVMVIGSDVLVAGRKPRRRKIAEALRGADAVIAVSRDLADHVERLGVNASRVEIVHTGVDPRIFHPGDQVEARRQLGLPEEGRRVLFVGNLLYSKGVGVLIDALAALKSRGVSVHGDFVGGGRDETALRAKSTAAGLEAIITFQGRQPHSALPDWYRASNVVCLPSDSEGIPNVLREATACGRPFVATRVGGIPEIADLSVDRLVSPRDPEALADAIDATLLAPPPPVDSPTRVPCPTWDEAARRLARRLEAVIHANS